MNQPITHLHKIFVIDDSDVDRFIFKRVLDKLHFAGEVQTFAFARIALQYLLGIQQNHQYELLPEVIFLDLNMPDMNGFEFMNHFMELTPAITDVCKVTIVSSSENIHDLIKAKMYPSIISYMSKPVEEKKLLNLPVESNKWVLKKG